ncbi:hypothetical protein C7974DRAFT_131470 [Boeremia exigua]|uniref:uncharacterized protein n=1 Tax=Boeremia exigua TaxID=749465 RepID=UPI001E8CAD2F|nr:uncharacterized protein C7974DRAFT_131470 [Boeremia exigua]KAH6639440.1 hypothetical protein C7974DRAFT_131470 [Boeremia exigua]
MLRVCSHVVPDRPEAPSQTHSGPDLRRRGQSHEHQSAPTLEPELTGASNASTSTRVNQIGFRGGTNPLERLRQRLWSQCRGSRYEAGCQCCTAVSSRLPYLVRRNAHCVLGDQTEPRGCTCCARLRRSISTMLAPAQTTSPANRCHCCQKKQCLVQCTVLSAAHLPPLVAGRYSSPSLLSFVAFMRECVVVLSSWASYVAFSK